MPPIPDQRSPNPNAPTATIYCEGEFGRLDGKTANGLVRHSEKYRVVSVVDSTLAGQDAGMVLDGAALNIPILANLSEVLGLKEGVPDTFIFGKAPATGMLSPHERTLILEAIRAGMNIINGLHEFLNDDPEFAAAALAHDITIRDIRRPRDKKDLRPFTGKLRDLPCRRIAVMGTDCAIGKRTTATILVDALNQQGIKAVLINTGQTGLIQGGRYGLAMDAVPSQFCAGELEATIMEAYRLEQPDVVVIEGQGALSHPAYSTSSFILRGSMPHGVILQHAPKRPHRCDFPGMAMPLVNAEINLIQTFADTRVIGVTINHEEMNDEELAIAISQHQLSTGLPVTDAVRRPPGELVNMVVAAFPELAVVEPARR